MRKLHNSKAIVTLIFCIAISMKLPAQEDKPELLLHLRHFTENNGLQYLKVQTQLKADNKLQPSQNVSVQLYLDTISANHLIRKISTDEKGTAQTVISPALKDLWMSSPDHKFIATAKANPSDEETVTELQIAKAKIEIDTLNEVGTRSVSVNVFSYNDGEWLPAKDVEVKIGVERLGGILNIGDDESYTTDSLGRVTAEFKLDSLPAGNASRDISLVAMVEDNDQFGTLTIKKTVPWGKYYKHTTEFGQRTLWASRFRSPLWLVFMAYSIIAGVWGVIIYLVIQIFKMKRLVSNQTSEKMALHHNTIILPEQL